MGNMEDTVSSLTFRKDHLDNLQNKVLLIEVNENNSPVRKPQCCAEIYRQLNSTYKISQATVFFKVMNTHDFKQDRTFCFMPSEVRMFDHDLRSPCQLRI
jgi:hypothetical protein